MLAGVTAPRLTYEDYLLFPEDGRRHELIDGDHVVTPAPTPKHQFVLSNLHGALWHYVVEENLGQVAWSPFDVVLSDVDVVQPDLFFLSHDRMDRLRENRLDGVPNLVVEVLSESTRKRDEILKLHLYEQHGALEYWVIDPELETVKVYRREDSGFGPKTELSARAGDTLTSPLFPELELDLDALFDVP